MLETIGLSDWNINLLKDNLLTEVDIRLKNISELEVLKTEFEITYGLN